MKRLILLFLKINSLFYLISYCLSESYMDSWFFLICEVGLNAELNCLSTGISKTYFTMDSTDFIYIYITLDTW